MALAALSAGTHFVCANDRAQCAGPDGISVWATRDYWSRWERDRDVQRVGNEIGKDRDSRGEAYGCASSVRSRRKELVLSGG